MKRATDLLFTVYKLRADQGIDFAAAVSIFRVLRAVRPVADF